MVLSNLGNDVFLGKYSAEEKFLLAQLARSEKNCDISSLDREKILSLADVHWLGSFLNHPSLKFSKKEIARIRKMRARELRRYSYFKKQLPFVLKALNVSKVEYAVLKGGYLAFEVFPAGFRYLSDIDIVVPDMDRIKASRALFNLGFREEKKRSSPGVTVMQDQNGMEVELDSKLGILERILPAKELLACKIKTKILGEKAYIPNKEYNLLHLCLHASLTHSFYDISKLADIDRFLRAFNVDMTLLEELARKKGVYRAVFLPIELTGLLWNNNKGLCYNVFDGPGKRMIEYNLSTALKPEYDRKAARNGYLIPLLLVESLKLKVQLIADYLLKKVRNG